MLETPSYIKQLLAHNGKPKQGRKVWSIDLEQVWLPFFTATNTVGDTAIAADALGCPIRLAKEQDGSVKYSKTGRPVTRVVKEIGDNVRMVRDNFTAGLVAYAEQVAEAEAEAFKAQVEASRLAGQPITRRDSHDLAIAESQRLTEAVAEATKGRKTDIKPKRELVEATA